MASSSAHGRHATTAAELYASVAPDYSHRRRPDPAWTTQIHRALGSARRIVNVGAGTGSYEPADRAVVALEPAADMISQRPTGTAPCALARAEALPVAGGAVDTSLAVLTVHHWDDPAVGLAEMRRISRRQVVVTWDPEMFATEFWLVRDYLPEIARRERGLATLSAVVAGLHRPTVEPLLVPADCTDGFLGAHWRRPEAYLDPSVRAAMSGLALLDQRVVERAMARLARDLDDGTWLARHRALLDLPALDLGYRLVHAVHAPDGRDAAGSGAPP